MTAKPDYGLDAPGVVRNMFLAALATAGLAVVGRTRAIPALTSAGAWMAVSFMLSGLLMIASSRVGKLRARDRLLDRLRLAGDERVLDVGCGHGLLLIGAARRVPQGRAVGIDLWSATDQHDNRADATLANARAEGVAERVEVRDGDMRALPFDDGSFDVVVSSLAVQNVADRAGRRTAMREICRVLRPGGRVALMDIAHVAEYASDLKEAGLLSVRAGGWSPWIFPPTRTVTGTKAAS